MDALQPYLPKTTMQITLAGLAAATATFILLRSLFRRTQKLSGKVCLITGASSGIGEALTHEFVKAGCKVIMAARSVDKLEKIKAQIVEMYKVSPTTVKVQYLDISDHDSIPTTIQDLITEFGGIDILVNNAGISLNDRVIRTELQMYKKIMDVNFLGQVAVTKEVLPSMIEKGGGSIVAVSSLQGRFALPGGSGYGATKHALQAFCDSLRIENIRKKIHVLVVSPSYVSTNIAVAGLRGDGSQPSKQRKEIERGMTAEYCAQRILSSVRNYESDLLLGPLHHRLLVYIRALFPDLYTFILSKLF